MSRVITKSSKKGQETSERCNLERDCIKSRRDQIGITRHIMMQQVLYNSKGLMKQSRIYFPGAKPVHVHCITVFCFFNQHLRMYTNVRTCTCAYLMACFVVRTDDIRSERVNEEILLGRQPISIQNCNSSCTISTCNSCLMVFTVYGICTARGLYVPPRAEPEEVHTVRGRYISHAL